MIVRLTRAGAPSVQRQLSARDLDILQSLRRVRLLSVVQVQRLHVHKGSPLTRARRTRGILLRLFRRKLVVRLPHVVGGVRAGSAGFVYALTKSGQAVVDSARPLSHSRPVWNTSNRFQNHRLAGSELYVQLVESDQLQLVEFSSEPDAWRHFTGMGGELIVLKPDGYVRVEYAAAMVYAFIEVDLGTESLPTIRKKLERYVAYRASGMEQQRTRCAELPYGLFPLVVVLVLDERRKRNISRVIRRLPKEEQSIFKVGLLDEGAAVIARLVREEGSPDQIAANGRAPP